MRGKEAIMVIEIDTQSDQQNILKNLKIAKDLYSKILFLPTERNL